MFGRRAIDQEYARPGEGVVLDVAFGGEESFVEGLPVLQAHDDVAVLDGLAVAARDDDGGFRCLCLPDVALGLRHRVPEVEALHPLGLDEDKWRTQDVCATRLDAYAASA